MLNYNNINDLFGAPLNTVGRPNLPFKFRTWHVIVVIIAGYVVYKGIKSIKNDYFIIYPPKIKKDLDTK